MFVASEQEPAKLKHTYSIEGIAQKPEFEIFQDVIENLVAIITARYSVYLLSCSSEMTIQIKLLNQEESKQPNTVSGDQKLIATSSNFDLLCTDYFRVIDSLAGAKGWYQYCLVWAQRHSSAFFMYIDNQILGWKLQLCIYIKVIQQFAIFDPEASQIKRQYWWFIKSKGFKKLLNLNSRQRGVVDASANYFQHCSETCWR